MGSNILRNHLLYILEEINFEQEKTTVLDSFLDSWCEGMVVAVLKLTLIMENVKIMIIFLETELLELWNENDLGLVLISNLIIISMELN